MGKKGVLGVLYLLSLALASCDSCEVCRSSERTVHCTHGSVTASVHFWIMRTAKTSRPALPPRASRSGRS